MGGDGGRRPGPQSCLFCRARGGGRASCRSAWMVGGRASGRAGPGGGLARYRVAQPLLFAIQVACVMALREAGIVPSACIGHSAGEVAAAWACGALTLEQACTVIARRSAAQQTTRGAGVMAALGLDAESAEALFAQEKLDIAI